MGCDNKYGGNCGEFDPNICSPFELTTSGDACYADSLIVESTRIAGAKLNVYKLLGVHEQGKLVDLVGTGNAVTSGNAVNFPAENAFNNYLPEWRSFQKGPMVVTAAFIGYDFSSIKLENGRDKYGIETRVKQHISKLKITQGCNSKNRISKARVERSQDGITWYGVDIINLLDDKEEHEYDIKQSVHSRFWRIRPLIFNGGPNDWWAVKKIELIDYAVTSLSNIQDDMGFMETRDRSYSTEPVQLKGYYDFIDVQTDLTKFGLELPSQQFFIRVPYSYSIALLGRPIIPGDIIEMPSEAQIGHDLSIVKKYVTVIDIGHDSAGFTSSWEAKIQRVIAQPMIASQETMDIVGKFYTEKDQYGSLQLNDEVFTSLSDIADHKITAAADTQLPEQGDDISSLRQLTSEELQLASDAGFDLSNIAVQTTGHYVEDGMPPANTPPALFTVGDEFPNNPQDGHYHRLTYTQYVKFDIPPRLYKWNSSKNEWEFIEIDRRYSYNKLQPTIKKYLSDPNKKGLDDI